MLPAILPRIPFDVVPQAEYNVSPFVFPKGRGG